MSITMVDPGSDIEKRRAALAANTEETIAEVISPLADTIPPPPKGDHYVVKIGNEYLTRLETRNGIYPTGPFQRDGYRSTDYATMSGWAKRARKDHPEMSVRLLRLVPKGGARQVDITLSEAEREATEANQPLLAFLFAVLRAEPQEVAVGWSARLRSVARQVAQGTCEAPLLRRVAGVLDRERRAVSPYVVGSFWTFETEYPVDERIRNGTRCEIVKVDGGEFVIRFDDAFTYRAMLSELGDRWVVAPVIER